MNQENRVLRNTEFRPLCTGIICGAILGVWVSFFFTPIFFAVHGIEISLRNFSLSTLAIVLDFELTWVLIYYLYYKET